jgi:hypothetical protein
VWSNDKFFKYDNHEIHYKEHVKYILSKEFRMIPITNQMLLINHTDIHNYMLKAQQAEMAQQQVEQQPAPAGQKPAQPMPAAGGTPI